jgi:hypothetical protein
MTKSSEYAEDLVAMFKNATNMEFLTAYSLSYGCDFSLETRHLYLNSETFMEKKLGPSEQGWLAHALAHAYSQFFFDEVPLTEDQYKIMLNNAAKYRIKPLEDLVAAMKKLKEEWRSTECDALVAECEKLLGEAPDGSVMVLNPYIRGKIHLYACGFHTPKFQEARGIVSSIFNGQIEVPKYGLNDEPLWYDEVF